MTHKIRMEHERLNSYTHKVGKFDLALYTTPPQRTWVGLTDEDRVQIKKAADYNQFMTAGEYADKVQKLTEEKLRSKNYG